ncbi:hypothetical protein QTP88_012955 [Uroleucon formosanum]
MSKREKHAIGDTSARTSSPRISHVIFSPETFFREDLSHRSPGEAGAATASDVDRDYGGYARGVGGAI